MKTPGKLTWSQKWRFGSDASPFPSGVIFFSGWKNISPILVGENNSSNVCFNEELLGNDDFYTATFSFFWCFSFSAFLPTRCFHLSKQQQIVLQKKTMELAFLLRKPFKEAQRKPLMASKNDSNQQKKMQLLGVGVSSWKKWVDLLMASLWLRRTW